MYSRIIHGLLTTQVHENPDLSRFLVLTDHVTFHQAFNLQTPKQKLYILKSFEYAISHIHDVGVHLILYYLYKELGEPYTHFMLGNKKDTHHFLLEDRHQLIDTMEEELDTERIIVMKKCSNRHSANLMEHQAFLRYIEKAEKDGTEKAYKELEDHDKHHVWEQLRQIIHGDGSEMDVELLGPLLLFMDPTQEYEKNQKIDMSNEETNVFDAFLSLPNTSEDEEKTLIHERRTVV